MEDGMSRPQQLLLAATFVIGSALVVAVTPIGHAQSAGPTLTGAIRSAGGARMEGVTVSARAGGSSITTSVFTDADGEYYFPPLPEGRYKVWAQAVGYETGRTEVSLAQTIAR